MRKTFFRYFLFLLYLESIFHFVCFQKINFFQVIFLFCFCLVISIICTFYTSLTKNERFNFAIFLISCVLFIIFFSAELVYYKIYDSFFDFSAIVFLGAIKDGADKVLLTIFQNIIPIILLFFPLVIFAFHSKKIPFFNRIDSFLLLFFFLLGIGYSGFLICQVDKEDTYSFYHLFFDVNMPVLNVKQFGLLPSSLLSLHRKIFGFSEKKRESEDILINKRTSLSDDAKVRYNQENIDFSTLISKEKDTAIHNLHQYFSEQIPTEKNDFTGMFKGKNLIFIVAESFDEIAIDEKLTPTLYHLKHDGIQFDNYFAPKYPASTADGEYMLEWGLLPIIGENYSLIDMVYNVNPYLLPRVFKNLHYKTYAYHNYFGYYNYRKKYFFTLNFDGTKYCEEGISTRCDHFHGSDVAMMEQTIDDYIGQEQFFAYYITLSGHGSYDSSNFIANEHISKLNGYAYPSNLKYYLAANIDFDIAMSKLMEKLKESGRLEDTVIVISSDHSPYYLTNEQVNLRSSMDRNNKFDRNRGSLIIYNPLLSENVHVSKYAMNIDVLPTVLNLFGITYDSRLIIGKDILANHTDGMVIFPDRSWVNQYGSYDSVTKQFTPYVSNVDPKYVEQITQEVNDKYQASVTMQYHDYYRYIFP